MTRDPFRLDGPTILNISGGRTSGYMLRRHLDAHGGTLPTDVHAVFCNTGKERPETLAFLAELSARWGVRLRWIERDLHKPAGARFREVTHETASRNGEPFDELIVERRFLPNGIMRFCTQDLKIRTARDFMRAQGHEHWTSVMGLRFDEPARVSRVRDREPDEWDVACPLYDARATKADVMAFWSAQPFDLALQSYQGNCDGCYLKARSILTRIERDRPGTLAWWDAKERERNARFKSSRRYLDIIRVAHATPSLPLDLDEEPSLPCHCTD